VICVCFLLEIFSTWSYFPCNTTDINTSTGGIVRNVFSPILSGGSVIACGGFDPLLFWDTLALQRVTWYYASPTMHQAILNEGGMRYVCKFCVRALSVCLLVCVYMLLHRCHTSNCSYKLAKTCSDGFTKIRRLFCYFLFFETATLQCCSVACGHRSLHRKCRRRAPPSPSFGPQDHLPQCHHSYQLWNDRVVRCRL
jgi:hypothetical protein